MSADLDAIALRETLLTADGKGKAAKEYALQSLLNAACAEAIAQDRKTREGSRTDEADANGSVYSQLKWWKNRIDDYGDQIMALHKQLAQQSAALVVAKEALEEIAGQSLSNEVPMDDIDFIELDYDEAYDDCVLCARDALAQLAEAPRDHFRDAKEMVALNRGEAVEDTARLDWLLERMDGAYLPGCNRVAWSINHFDERNNLPSRRAIDKARAPSRTEREDTAPEVGGKGES